jgi:hypothetical protein
MQQQQQQRVQQPAAICGIKYTAFQRSSIDSQSHLASGAPETAIT